MPRGNGVGDGDGGASRRCSSSFSLSSSVFLPLGHRAVVFSSLRSFPSTISRHRRRHPAAHRRRRRREEEGAAITYMGAIPDFVASETGWIVAGVAANLAILIALCNIIRHLRNYHTPHLQIWTVRIIVIVPVYAFVSWMSLKLPEEALYFNTVRDVYEAYIIYCFIALMLAYGGGENNCLVLMRSRGHLAHPFPFNFCLQPMLLDAKFMRRCKQGCIQFVILKPILALMSLVLMGVGKYDSTGYQAFLLTVYNISYTVALYYLFLFYLATREILKEQHIVLKFFVRFSIS